MAKVIFPATVSYMSGKVAEGVYTITSKPGLSYMRQYSYPKIPDHNHDLAKVTQHLSKLWNKDIRESYKEELAEYARKHRSFAVPGKPYSEHALNNFAYFILVIYKAKEKGDITIPLDQLTKIYIEYHFAYWGCVCDACKIGFLEKVPGYEKLTALMQNKLQTS